MKTELMIQNAHAHLDILTMDLMQNAQFAQIDVQLALHAINVQNVDL